jgi:hypothetical protein
MKLRRAWSGIVEGVDAVLQRRRVDGAGADGIAADALADEVGRHALGQADHRGLGGAVDERIGHPLMLEHTLAMLMMLPRP